MKWKDITNIMHTLQSVRSDNEVNEWVRNTSNASMLDRRGAEVDECGREKCNSWLLECWWLKMNVVIFAASPFMETFHIWNLFFEPQCARLAAVTLYAKPSRVVLHFVKLLTHSTLHDDMVYGIKNEITKQTTRRENGGGERTLSMTYIN